MSTEKEVMKKCLTYLITVNKLNRIRQLKDELVQQQKYDQASEIRAQELELISGLLTVEQLIELLVELENSTP